MNIFRRNRTPTPPPPPPYCVTAVLSVKSGVAGGSPHLRFVTLRFEPVNDNHAPAS